VVLFLIVIAGLLVSMSTFAFLRDAELEHGMETYHVVVTTVQDMVLDHSETLQRLLPTLSHGCTSQAATLAQQRPLGGGNNPGSGSVFPFVTWNDFSDFAEPVLELVPGMTSVFYTPLVYY